MYRCPMTLTLMITKLTPTLNVINNPNNLLGFHHLLTSNLLPPFSHVIISNASFSPMHSHSFTRNPSSSSSSSPSGGRGRGNTGLEDDRQRFRGHGRGRGSSRAPDMDRVDALGRLLVRILRHQTTDLKLNMRSDGYVSVVDMLKLNIKTRANIPLSSYSVDEVREAVRVDNKQRLGLLEEDGTLYIRANQGHTVQTIETESLLKPILSAEEISVCVHGTYRRLLQSILESGLKRMDRVHIHFACGLPTDGKVVSGTRSNINILIFIDLKKAMEDGMKFYLSENKVVLTEGFDGAVPAKYFQRIETWPRREPIPFQK